MIYSPKGRKITVGEKIEIAAYYIDNHKGYQRTTVTYNDSYQSIYLWVKKYENGGYEALEDKRGRTKPKVELMEEEKFKFRSYYKVA